MPRRSTSNISGTLLDRVYRNPIFNETIRDVSNPQLNTGATVADRLGINYDLDEILKIFQDAVAAGNAVTQEMYDQATDKYYQNVAAQTADYLDSMRKANAEALTTGASRGVAAANELSTMLGMSQQGQDAALDLALEGLNLGDQMGADMAQAYEDAYNQYNDLGLQMGQLDNEAFAYLVQQYLGELQFLAEQQALMNSGANIGQYYPNYGGGSNVGVGVGIGGSGNGEFTPYDRDAQEIVNQLGEDTIANIFQLGLQVMEAARGADSPAPSMGGYLNPNPDYINKIANEYAQGSRATGEGGALVENMYNQGTTPQREVSGPSKDSEDSSSASRKFEPSQVGGAATAFRNPVVNNMFAQGLNAMLNQSNEDDDEDGTEYNPDTGRGSDRIRSIAAMRQAVAKQAQKTPAATTQNALRNRTQASSKSESTPYNRSTVQTQNRPSYSSSSSSRRSSSSSSYKRPSSSSKKPSSSGSSNRTSKPVNSSGVTVNKPGYNTSGWIGNNRPSSSSSKPSSNGMFGGITGNIIGNAIKGSISSALNQKKKK